MMRRTFQLLVLASIAACAATDDAPDAPAKVEIGARVPSYSALSMAGDSVSLAGLKGKVVLLNVWATWCAPCRKEIPELRALHATYKDRGLELIGVSIDTDGTDASIRDFLTEFKMDYPIWRDPDERISARFKMAGVPATFLIDKAGILRWKTLGPIAPGDTSLSSAITRALGSN